MLIIKIKEGEKIDRALKRYKRKFSDTKVGKALRDGKYFKKKSVKKREEKQRAIYIQKKNDESTSD